MTKNKAGRPTGTDTGESFYEIVREISDATELKPAIVESVLRCWSDIFVRNVILFGKFHWSRCFSVSTKIRKEHMGYNVVTKKPEIRPETKILQMSLSKRVRNFWRWSQRNKRNEEHGVSKDNWQSWYDNNETKEQGD